MATAILSIVAGLMMALPQILLMIESRYQAKQKEKHAGIISDIENIDILIPPQP